MRAVSSFRSPRRSKPHPPILWLLPLLVLGPGLAGCGGGESGAPAEEEVTGPPDQTYTVRARVVALPDTAPRGERQVRVRHDAIPDFVGFEGEVVGMSSMTMPFPVAAGVSLDGIAVGDPVEMTFEVRWDGSPALRIVELTELPSGTELDFETAESLPAEGEA